MLLLLLLLLTSFLSKQNPDQICIPQPYTTCSRATILAQISSILAQFLLKNFRNFLIFMRNFPGIR